jgi:hypothetical protein
MVIAIIFLCPVISRFEKGEFPISYEDFLHSYFQRTYFPFIDTDFVSIVRPISMPGKRK